MNAVSIYETGFFFGTFNPIHIGHLILAQTALRQLPLQRICFIPAGQHPQKHASPDMAAAKHRLKMVALAVNPYSEFFVLDWECMSSEMSYTIHTLQKIRNNWKIPETFKLPFILGSDALQNLPTWHQPEAIIQQSLFVQAVRSPASDTFFQKQQQKEQTVQSAENAKCIKEIVCHGHKVPINTVSVSMPAIQISSSVLRQQLKAGQTPRFWVPDSVLTYIKHNHLYA